MAQVSIIVPCYNQAKYLSEALLSVYNQTYQNWECIIVNDGSPDNTEEVALEWCKKDERFRYLKKENGGLSSARNAGLKVASGQYIQFLDADDAIDRNKFSIQVNELSKIKDYALSYTDYFNSTETNLLVSYPLRYLTPRFKSSNFLHELIANWESKLSIPCHCFLFGSNLFKDNNIEFDESLPNHEDWDCWMKIFNLNPKVLFLDQRLATYRIQSASMCQDVNALKKGFSRAVVKQQKIHKGNKEEYKLLKIKYNVINYGVTNPYTFVCILFNYSRKLKVNINKLLPASLKKSSGKDH